MKTNTEPATMSQWYLTAICGHLLTRNGGGAYTITANPERTERTPSGIGHVPYADEDAAERVEKFFARIFPAKKTPRVCTGGYPVFRCNRCDGHPLYSGCACK